MPATATPATTSDPVRVATIIGSTRQGRAGEPIARWFVTQVDPRDDFDLDLIDLAELDLPVVLPDFDATELPEAVATLGRRLDAADAFVVITPEYNHGYPASLKNAIDWFSDEWVTKPIAFVCYGGVAQGTRSVEQLRQVFVELHAMTTRDIVSIDLSETDRRGWPTSDGVEGAAKLLLDELRWWALALRDARATRPYVT